MEKRVILGIDPGTRVTGYGIVEQVGGKLRALNFGCIRPPVKCPLFDRYLIIYNDIEQLIKEYCPGVVSVEAQFMKDNFQSAVKLGMAKGACIIAARKQEIPVLEYAPTQAKLAVTGNGQASKEQVRKMVQVLLNLSQPPNPLDATDALSLAICHSFQTSKYSVNETPKKTKRGRRSTRHLMNTTPPEVPRSPASVLRDGADQHKEF